MTLTAAELERCAEIASGAARAAGQLIARARPRAIDRKPGATSAASGVVTEVDRRSERLLLAELEPVARELDLGVLSEEREDDGSRLRKRAFWSVDPLDGTLPYVEGKPGYAVSVALVARDGEPLVGVAYLPARDSLYCAVRGRGVRCNDRPWRLRAAEPGASLSVYLDRSFRDAPDYDRNLAALEAIARDRQLADVVLDFDGAAVSNALSALDRAPGCYFKLPTDRPGGGSLWDFAATARIFLEAGAVASDMHGAPLDLNRADSTYLNHRGVVFATDAELAARLRALCRPASRRD